MRIRNKEELCNDLYETVEKVFFVAKLQDFVRGHKKDDEGVYEQYTARRTDAVPCEIMQLQQERGFFNSFYDSSARF